MVDLTSPDVFQEMLGTNDIKKGQITSLLNSSFIETIARRALQTDLSYKVARPYFEEHLKIFVTLSNLRGFWYDLFFRSASERSSYFIHRHNDYARFRLNTTAYGNDGWIPLDFYSGTSVQTAMDAAMATGAFPIGLQARKITRNAKHVNDIFWLQDVFRKNPLPDGEYESLNVDGGMIDNEPFENVRKVLKEITNQHHSVEFNSFNNFKSTVLMIDPFPGVEPVYNPSNTLFNIIGGTLGALINQARVKPEALMDALNEDCAGQFLIAPTRKVPQLDGGPAIKETGAKAIACGAFGGFSGFLNKEFRIHDYFLGRANCEKFLRDHFTVPENSTNIVTQGYEDISPEQRHRYYAMGNPDKVLPIIPILTDRQNKYLPKFSSSHDWPVQSKNTLRDFKPLLKRRTESILLNLADYNTFTWLALAAGSRIILRRKIAGAVLSTIHTSLHEHQLIPK